MPYPAKAVANEFLELAKESGMTISPMKLQKLVYFAHGWHLALTDRPLIEERIEAWQYGPVIPVLYREFKTFGNSPITKPAVEIDYENLRFAFTEPHIDRNGEDEEAENAIAVIGQVWKAYGKYSAVQLSNATHAQGTPWEKAYNPELRSTEIPDNAIREYFLSLKERNAASA